MSVLNVTLRHHRADRHDPPLSRGRYEYALLCLLVLVLLWLPDFLERKLSIEIPSVLEAIILCFIFAAEILRRNRRVLRDNPVLGHDAPHHLGLPRRRHRIRARRHPQPKRAVAFSPHAYLHGGHGVLLLDDHRRAVGAVRVHHGHVPSASTCRKTPSSPHSTSVTLDPAGGIHRRARRRHRLDADRHRKAARSSRSTAGTSTSASTTPWRTSSST